jgi:hypothetical protein
MVLSTHCIAAVTDNVAIQQVRIAHTSWVSTRRVCRDCSITPLWR